MSDGRGGNGIAHIVGSYGARGVDGMATSWGRRA